MPAAISKGKFFFVVIVLGYYSRQGTDSRQEKVD